MTTGRINQRAAAASERPPGACRAAHPAPRLRPVRVLPPAAPAVAEERAASFSTLDARRGGRAATRRLVRTLRPGRAATPADWGDAVGRPAPIRLCRAGGRSSFDRSPDCDRRDGPAELSLPRPPSNLANRQRKRQKPPALALDTRGNFSRVGRPVTCRHRGATRRRRGFLPRARRPVRPGRPRPMQRLVESRVPRAGA